MRRRKNLAESRRLEMVQKRFERWRKKRTNGKEQIPERLWRAAASLVGPMKITEVSRELGLEWAKLKKKVGDPSTWPAKKATAEQAGCRGLICGAEWNDGGNGQPACYAVNLWHSST